MLIISDDDEHLIEYLINKRLYKWGFRATRKIQVFSQSGIIKNIS